MILPVQNGELPICIMDLLLFKTNIFSFDIIEQRVDSILFYKNQEQHVNVTICEIRKSKSKGKRLYLKTMYNRKRL